MTKKMFLLGLFVAAAVVGRLNAQAFSTGLFASNSNFGFNLARVQAQGQYSGDESEVTKARRQEAMKPVKAGLQNMVFGRWSWRNDDKFGGALTAGLEGGGLALTIVGLVVPSSGFPKEDTGGFGQKMGVLFGGVVVLTGGIIYGYFRGSGQYKKQNAVGKGFEGNPLEHVGFGMVPDTGGMLIYTARF
jgi:hypothetical protein